MLVGSAALPDAVASEPALSDRVDLRVTIQPLKGKEVVGYLHHRIRAAGGNPAIFESSAVASLTRLCAGLPRRINALADDALYAAHRAGRVSATAAHVERAAAELGIDEGVQAAPPEPASPPQRPERHVATSAQPRRREAPAAQPLLEELDELDLGEVVAEPTGRRATQSASAAHAGGFASARAFDGGADEQGAGATRDFKLDDSSELEDLFADIVDE